MSVESNPGLHWFCFTVLCEWSRKLAPPSKPIRYKTKTNRDLVTRVFPRLRPVTCVYFDFSLAPSDIFVCSNWPLWFLWFWFYDTQSKSALNAYKLMTRFTILRQFDRHSFCSNRKPHSVLFSIWKPLSSYNHDTTKFGGGLIRLGGRRKSWGLVFGLFNHYRVMYLLGHGDPPPDDYSSVSFGNTYIDSSMNQDVLELLIWESVGNLHVLKTELSLKPF